MSKFVQNSWINKSGAIAFVLLICLRKNGMPLALKWSRMARVKSGCMSWQRSGLMSYSPETMTQVRLPNAMKSGGNNNLPSNASKVGYWPVRPRVGVMTAMSMRTTPKGIRGFVGLAEHMRPSAWLA